MTAHQIVVRQYGPAALRTVPLIRRAALDATRDVVGGDKILMLSVGASSLVAEPLRLAAELTTRPSARQRAHILGAADQITAALLAMALHELGVPAVSLTWDQVGLTPRSVTEGARSGQLNCDRVRAAIEQHPAVVLASACAATGDGDISALDDSVVRLAAIALGRALDARYAVTDTRTYILNPDRLERTPS
jgi:aspartate kinase